MADLIKLFHGTQAAYNSLAEKVPYGLYFITDTEKIYKGTNLVGSNNVKVVSTMPELSNAIEGMLYVHTETNPVKTSIKILNAAKTAYTTLASSDSLITKDSVTEFTNKTIDADKNTISNLLVSNFNADAVSTAIPTYNSETHAGTGVDTKFVTEKAITDALADTIISVDYTAPEGESGPVLLFTSKNGIQKSINIPRDNFLSAAVLNNDTKELELTMVTGDVIKIPVSDLMVTELDTDHIVLSEDVNVMGSDWGSWLNGSTMSKGITLTNILKKGVATQIPPTYKSPTIAIANNSGTAAGKVEVGSTVSVKVKSTFTKNDAGNLTAHRVYKGGTAVGTSVTTTPTTYEETFVMGDSNVTYTSKATYGDGAIKNDNLGDPYPTGQIKSATITSSNYTYTAARYGFYGASATEIASTSDAIRGLTKTVLGPANGTSFNITIPAGSKYVVFAYPASLRAVNQVTYVEIGDTGMASSFSLETVKVADARGGSNGLTDYKVYKFQTAGPAQSAMTFKVTI